MVDKQIIQCFIQTLIKEAKYYLHRLKLET